MASGSAFCRRRAEESAARWRCSDHPGPHLFATTRCDWGADDTIVSGDRGQRRPAARFGERRRHVGCRQARRRRGQLFLPGVSAKQTARICSTPVSSAGPRRVRCSCSISRLGKRTLVSDASNPHYRRATCLCGEWCGARDPVRSDRLETSGRTDSDHRPGVDVLERQQRISPCRDPALVYMPGTDANPSSSRTLVWVNRSRA